MGSNRVFHDAVPAAFLLVFTVLRTAVNSDFVYSSMACSAIGLACRVLGRRAWMAPGDSHGARRLWDRHLHFLNALVLKPRLNPAVYCGALLLMLCSFTNQVLAQLDLLRCWKESTAYKNDLHLLPTQLNEKVPNLHLPAHGGAHCTRCGAHCPILRNRRFLFVQVSRLKALATAVLDVAASQVLTSAFQPGMEQTCGNDADPRTVWRATARAWCKTGSAAAFRLSASSHLSP